MFVVVILSLSSLSFIPCRRLFSSLVLNSRSPHSWSPFATFMRHSFSSCVIRCHMSFVVIVRYSLSFCGMRCHHALFVVVTDHSLSSCLFPEASTHSLCRHASLVYVIRHSLLSCVIHRSIVRRHSLSSRVFRSRHAFFVFIKSCHAIFILISHSPHMLSSFAVFVWCRHSFSSFGIDLCSRHSFSSAFLLVFPSRH